MAEITLTDEQPTRARLSVVILLCTLAFVLYMDRVCMSQAVEPIKAEFGLDNVQISYVLNAFLLAYALFEAPTGRWGDRYGSRNVLTRIVIWWSAFTALTGATSGLASLMAIRFLFGAGEAGAYPNAARVIRNWFPQQERGRVQAMIMASGMLGGIVAQVLAGYLIAAIGWRGTFVVFGIIGLNWAAAFWWTFRETPAAHPNVNREEQVLIEGAIDSPLTPVTHAAVPWRAALSNRSFWLLGAITACGAFTSYLYFSWYPTYMKEARGMSSTHAGWLSATVLVGGMVGTLCGGGVSDWLVRHTANASAARRIFGFGVGVVAAALVVAAVRSQSTWATVAFAAVSYLVMTLELAIWWTSVTELAGRHVGTIFGVLNAMGVFGGFLSQYLFGAMADWRGGEGFSGREQWDPAFYVYAVVLLLGGFCWLAVDTSKRIDANIVSGETQT